MPFTTFYKSDFYIIEVDLEGNMLRSEWLRQANDDELKLGGIKLYEALRDTKVERAIANAQVLGGVSTSTKDWLANEFYELLSETSLRKLARVMPNSVFHQIALESVITRAEALGKVRFQIKNFQDYNEAIAWLSA